MDNKHQPERDLLSLLRVTMVAFYTAVETLLIVAGRRTSFGLMVALRAVGLKISLNCYYWAANEC
ncbi:MAG: hypothetical protein WBG23_11890 [Acidobacteriaceae bacterium]